MKIVLILLALITLISCVSDNIEAITSCWLLTVQDNQKSKTFEHVIESVSKRYQNNNKDQIIHNMRVYMVKRCFTTISLQDSKQIIQDFEAGQQLHIQFRDVVKGYDYTQYIKDLKNKDLIVNQQLDDTISQIITTLEQEFNKEQQQQQQQATPQIGVFGFNLNYLLVFPIIGVVVLVYMAISVMQSLKPKKKK